MKIKIAINGYGRIGKSVLRAIYENNYSDTIELVAINGISNIKTSSHLTQYDSIHGKFNYKITHDENHIYIDNHAIKCYNERNPDKLPWSNNKIDIVLECSGKFNDGEIAKSHIKSGAKKVLISAPAKNVDKTIVYGVNNNLLTKNDLIVSNASCTTNCLAPLVHILNQEIGISSGLMTTIHAVTNDQNLLDANHSDLNRARAAMNSMIPTKTGAASSIGLVIPALKGKLDGLAVRVPTLNVSLVDLTFISNKETSKDEINNIIKNASNSSMKNIIRYNDDSLVSCDFNHTNESSIFDSNHTKAQGKLIKILAWYDNEWGFANRMLDMTQTMNDA